MFLLLFDVDNNCLCESVYFGSDIHKKVFSLIELSYYLFYESYIQDHILFADQDVLFPAKEIFLKVLLVSLFSCGFYFYFLVYFV